jgi:hypothetical protein
VGPVHLALAGHAGQQPAQLGDLGDVALAVEDHALGVQAGGQPGGGDLQARAFDAGRVVALDQRVVVGHEEEALRAGLAAGGDGRAQGAHVVAEVQGAGGGDAGQDTLLHGKGVNAVVGALSQVGVALGHAWAGAAGLHCRLLHSAPWPSTPPLVLRTSFRQLLLLAFVLTAAALGAVSLSGLQALQGLMAKSREAAQQAVVLNLAVSGLGDRATDMERAARQYLVLGDPVLRQRYDAAVREARNAMQPLVDFEPTAAQARHWLSAAAQIRRLLDASGMGSPERDQALSQGFEQLGEGTRRLTVQVQRSIAERNQAVQDALESQRPAWCARWRWPSWWWRWRRWPSACG